MSDKNLVILIGRLGSDPESRSVGDTTVCNFSVATGEEWKDKSGEKQSRTEWHRCEVWGKSAENCQRFLSKGRLVCVEGSIRTDKVGEGSEAKFYTKIRANRVDFLGSKGDAPAREPGEDPEPYVPSKQPDDNLVF